MLAVVIIVLLSVAFLFFVEYLSKSKKYPPEFSRKLIHISGGTAAAFTPWFLSWHQIEIIALLLLLAMIASRYLHLFSSIYAVDRNSIGDILFAFSIGLIAIIAHDRLIFAVALLHMGLADGLAALIGSKYGKTTGYKVLGHQKSLIGSGVFWLSSFIILLWYLALDKSSASWTIILWLPLLTTVLEAVGVEGTDNVLVPLVVTLILNRL